MQHHVRWPHDKSDAPVFINAVGSVDEILNTSYLSTKLKESGLETLGIMIDADDRPIQRWQSLCSLCKSIAPTIPRAMPQAGLIAECETGLRLGFWIMPDCSSTGMLENFLRHLVPTSPEALWEHAQASASHARILGAPYRDVHKDKAQIHSWLAWQDPPGERMGLALTQKILNPYAATAMPFVRWFMDLYQLQGLDGPEITG
jgi:hypothetical protein